MQYKHLKVVCEHILDKIGIHLLQGFLKNIENLDFARRDLVNVIDGQEFLAVLEKYDKLSSENVKILVAAADYFECSEIESVVEEYMNSSQPAQDITSSCPDCQKEIGSTNRKKSSTKQETVYPPQQFSNNAPIQNVTHIKNLYGPLHIGTSNIYKF